MSTIKVICIDQALAFENTPVIASGGLEEDFISFTFCNQWTGFTRTAVFWRTEKDAYHVLLDGADRCQIPPEVTADEGTIFFGVFGVDGTGAQRTTEVLTYHIKKGAITTGTKPSEPTQDIYTQLLAAYAKVQYGTLTTENIGLLPETAETLGLPNGSDMTDALLALANKESETEGAVLYTEQALTEEQKAQARANIGAATENNSTDGGAVLYDTVQDLPVTQQARARSNIGAVSADDVTTAINTALGNYQAALAGLDAIIGGEDG